MNYFSFLECESCEYVGFINNGSGTTVEQLRAFWNSRTYEGNSIEINAPLYVESLTLDISQSSKPLSNCTGIKIAPSGVTGLKISGKINIGSDTDNCIGIDASESTQGQMHLDLTGWGTGSNMTMCKLRGSAGANRIDIKFGGLSSGSGTQRIIHSVDSGGNDYPIAESNRVRVWYGDTVTPEEVYYTGESSLPEIELIGY
jgi:hypothetical protein